MKSEISLCILLVVTVSASWDNDIHSNVLPLSVENRILGGIIASPGTFPYMVPIWALKVTPQGIEYGSFCGASLISDEFVLTAAHCVNGDFLYIKLYFGARVTSRDSEPGRVDMKVPRENVIIHEGYSRYMANDIALIKLTQKVNFTREIQPVKLPGRSQTNLDGRISVITGWGAMGSEASHSDILRYAQLRILPDETCKNFYKIYYHPSNICIDGKRQSACSGDSGGAAVIIEKDRTFTQVGIASYVASGGCENGNPIGYTRVSSFLDWIHMHTGIPIRD